MQDPFVYVCSGIESYASISDRLQGNDCEFRHSESARVNPRDCRYWLAGSCLNWSCPFRHPPLEGRPVVAPNAPAVSGGENRSRTPCFYFAQGFCSRGEACHFLHGTPSAGSKSAVAQLPVKVLATNGNESTEKNSLPGANGVASKPHIEVKLETQAAKEPKHVQAGGVQASPRKEVRNHPSAAINQNGASTKGRTDGSAPIAGHGSGARLRIRQVQHGDERMQNGVESDEWWEESSPGFDVLVDDGPEQSRYHDDPEFQSAGEAGTEPGKGGAGNRGRGRSMRMGDEMEQYDYDYPHSYEHAKYEGGASYERGGYEYGAREQQGGYVPAVPYERLGHQRGGGYPERGGAEDMLVRERLGLPIGIEGRSGGMTDPRSRIGSIKRRRPDGGQQLPQENHPRRQRTDMTMDEYQQHHMLQEDPQKQHELQLRHQLFMQHRIRNPNSNDNGGRRLHEKGAIELPGVARRALQDIGADAIPVSERVPIRPGLKGRPAVDHLRSGIREGELGRKDPHGDPGLVDLDGNWKTETEVRRDPSTFAGPKTLAQIKAEKAKTQVDDPSRLKDTSNGSKTPAQVVVPSKGAVGRIQHQTSLSSAADATSSEVSSAEERKIKLDKVVPNEPKKPAAFEGPKSLSAILREKRKIEPEMDAKQEAARSDHLQRISPSGNTVATATGVATSSAEESKRDEVNGEVGPDPDVEDGELLSDEDAVLKNRNEAVDQGRENYAEGPEDQLEGTSPRDRQWQQEEAPHSVDGVGEEDTIEEYDDVQDYEGGRESDAEHVEGEGYGGLDDEEEDDFAKKLGNFFS
ncbi:hypothetical protein R1sor_020621 [Riccia sorocarpa]|uniref:C3H1-type domain-containing protein n=1 Tax=Riccia sorocarpa TaxID=122646 RepID=A0ABD3GI10_9MARC